MNFWNEIISLNQEVPWYFAAVFFVLGAIVGSFLNVCIYRIPKDVSIVYPGSRCSCGAPIAWYDNVPILSWLILRGKSRCCGRSFSFRYPAVEFLTAVLYLLCWTLFPWEKAVAGMVLSSALICAAFIDIDHMFIPDRFTVGAAVAGVALALFLPGMHGYEDRALPIVASFYSGYEAVLGLLIGSGVLLWIAVLAETVLRKEAMGFGDVKLMGAIGAFAGWQGALFAIFGGAIIGTIGITLLAAYRYLTGKSVPLLEPSLAEVHGETEDEEPDPGVIGRPFAFGPMLALAALLYFFFLHPWVDAYFEDIALVFTF